MTDERPPPGIDVSRPHAARVYDWALGGKDNFAADREYGERLVAALPEYPRLARANRDFLVRAVRHIAESGVRQFVDLGTGIPTSPNVHEVARSADPAARVVYVDNDPIVAVHNDALLETDDGIATIVADIRRPVEVLAHPRLTGLIDFAEPVGLLCVAVLHLIPDEDDPADVLARYGERLAPHSHLVLTQPSSDGDREMIDRARDATAGTAIQVRLRSAAEIRGFFAGFELLDPGVVPVEHWRHLAPSASNRVSVLGGVARKP